MSRRRALLSATGRQRSRSGATTQRSFVNADELNSAYGVRNAPTAPLIEPDTVVGGLTDRVTWYHRNVRSLWPETLSVQALSHLNGPLTDPILHRTFGATLHADGFSNATSTRLVSDSPRDQRTLHHRCPDGGDRHRGRLADSPRRRHRRSGGNPGFATPRGTHRLVEGILGTSLDGGDGGRRGDLPRQRRLPGHAGLSPAALHAGLRGSRRDADQVQRLDLHGGRHLRLRRRLSQVGALLLVAEHAPAVLDDAGGRRPRPDGAALQDVPGRPAAGPRAGADLLWSRRRLFPRSRCISGAPGTTTTTDGTGPASPTGAPTTATSAGSGRGASSCSG